MLLKWNNTCRYTSYPTFVRVQPNFLHNCQILKVALIIVDDVSDVSTSKTMTSELVCGSRVRGDKLLVMLTGC